jgi:ABC-type lipoprotein release transport system permease subunit
MPLPRAHQLFNTDRVSYVTVLLNNRADGKGWVRQFNNQAQADGIDIYAQRWQDHPFGELYNQTMDFLQVFRNLVMAIILVVVSMAAINTFVKIIHERRREIGTMRCLGYRPAHILRLFSIEAALLSVAGSALGVLLALLCGEVINRLGVYYKGGLLSEGIPFRISFFVSDFLWISLLLTLLTMIATLLPTLATNRQNLVNVLEDR